MLFVLRLRLVMLYTLFDVDNNTILSIVKLSHLPASQLVWPGHPVPVTVLLSFCLPSFHLFDVVTVGFHNFNLRIFNLRVSNPSKLIVDVF